MILIKKNELFLLEEIVKKNFAAKYKGSVLGILWSVIKPLVIMILMTIIFSTVFSRSIENYPIYLLSGKCIYDFFSAGTNLSAISLKGNQNILKKTDAPKHIFVLGSILSEFVNFLISLMILVSVMIVTNSTFHLGTMFLSIITIISLLLMMIGLGLILSISSVYYTDVEHLWSLVMYLQMYACAIFYPMDIIPEPYHQYMILNPFYWIIDQFRSFVVYGVIPNYTYILNSILLSSIVLVFGIIIFKKYEKVVTMKF